MRPALRATSWQSGMHESLFGIAALILALGIAFFFERQAKRETGHGIL